MFFSFCPHTAWTPQTMTYHYSQICMNMNLTPRAIRTAVWSPLREPRYHWFFTTCSFLLACLVCLNMSDFFLKYLSHNSNNIRITIQFDFTGNLMVLWVLLRYIKLKTMTDAFLLNLTLSDLMLAVTLPLWAYNSQNVALCKLMVGVYQVGIFLNCITF